MNSEEKEREVKRLEKFIDFYSKNSFYHLLSGVITVPMVLNALAYKKPIKYVFYLNVVFGIILIAYGIYVLYQYESIFSYIDWLGDFAKNLGVSEAEMQAKMAESKASIKSLIGNRCTIMIVVSVLLGLVTLYWNARKLVQQPRLN